MGFEIAYRNAIKLTSGRYFWNVHVSSCVKHTKISLIEVPEKVSGMIRQLGNSVSFQLQISLTSTFKQNK